MNNISKLTFLELLALVCQLQQNNSHYCLYKSKKTSAIYENSDYMNLEDMISKSYAYLFKSENQLLFMDEITTQIKKLENINQRSFDEVFDVLEVLQAIGSTALWKYEMSLLANIEEFVRDFDRIDDSSERVRIIKYYQA
jgi:hypothetical protein